MDDQLQHCKAKLEYEIDPWDLNEALGRGDEILVVQLICQSLSPAPTSQLQRSQPRGQGGVVSPPGVPSIATHGRRLTQLHRGLFHAHRDFRVSIRGLQADVSEPAADHIHLDAGFEEMDGRCVPKHVRRDPTRRRRRGGFETSGMQPHAFVDCG